MGFRRLFFIPLGTILLDWAEPARLAAVNLDRSIEQGD
jgi:hypothetical protein